MLIKITHKITWQGEDDNDATNTSDGEDLSSVQGNDVESNADEMGGCIEEQNEGEPVDGLAWNNGIGTLVGSDLKVNSLSLVFP